MKIRKAPNPEREFPRALNFKTICMRSLILLMDNSGAQETRKPFFTFPDIKSTGNFSFEKLNGNNFQQLYIMFENDDNIFTDERFKHYDSAEKYAKYLEMYGAYSPKHGAQDWLWLWKENYAGVLHLYDLSLENFADNNKRCWIGFATKPQFRNKGITIQAVKHFIQYIFENYAPVKYIHAMTDPRNKAAQQLLLKLNFEKDFIERNSKELAFYVFNKDDE